MKARFATHNSGSEAGCEQIIFKSKGGHYDGKLTYNTGMMLDEIYWNLKKKTLSNNTIN
ncbi:MAG: hypothetical protein WBP45_11940 [Daejeonella sp.]